MGSASEERAFKGAASGDTRKKQRGAPPVGVGREELRAAVLKPYLLRLRAERGEGAARALLASVGIPASVLEDETGWISIGAAQRALNALATALGEQAIARRGDWMTHPETLGAYVRMLRVASEPIDAYRYLTANYAESTRVGSYELSVFGRGRLQIVYRPRRDVEARQDDPLLCLARRAEFASVPRLWGLDEARVEDIACIVRGDDCCKYAVRWRPSRARRVPLGALAGGIVCAAAVALSGSFVAAGIALVVGAVLGAIVGMLTERVAEERAARIFEKNRIAALERGLELRGQLGVSPGDLTGTVLGGKYRIIRKIGSGGIGAVYEAEHVALGSHVAVKVLRGAAAADAAEIARLRREARVQVSIEHSNVVRTLDLDQMPDGSIFVVMELLHGASVAERLRASGPLAPGFAIPVFMQVCRALEAAHKLGIVHRDLKPGNVFVCEDRSVKVLDFGMSKFAEAESLTQEGYTLGTPEYMSPEQCIGAPVEPRTDLYAFGVLMYEALTGEIPIRGRNRRELLDLHQRAVPTPMRDRRPDLKIPPELESVVLECLAKRLEDRPPSARTVERLLAAVPAEGLVHEYPPGTSRKAPAARRSAG
jgi:eukaryotic-like serine/threonine-protein kinase